MSQQISNRKERKKRDWRLICWCWWSWRCWWRWGARSRRDWPWDCRWRSWSAACCGRGGPSCPRTGRAGPPCTAPARPASGRSSRPACRAWRAAAGPRAPPAAQTGNCYSNKNSITKYITDYFKLCIWHLSLSIEVVGLKKTILNYLSPITKTKICRYKYMYSRPQLIKKESKKFTI